MYIVEIGIGNGKAAAVGQCVVIFSGSTVGYFSYSTGHIGGRSNGGCIISAGDGNGHGLFNGAAFTVINGDGVDLGQNLACGQIVNVAIRNGKFPIDLPSAVTGGVIADGGCKGAPIISCGGFKGDGLYIVEIDIGNGKAASVGQCVAIFSGSTVGYFSYSTGHIGGRSNGGCIISAGDGNGHGLFNGTALTVINGDGVGLGQGLA